MSAKKPLIGITLGDYNGIGPEVILKALSNSRLLNWCTPVVYGSQKVLSFYKKDLDIKDWSMKTVTDLQQITEFNQSYLVSCWDDTNTLVEPGKETPEAGKAAFACLDRSAKDLDWDCCLP
ncbi:MAG: 4-hydroxythreonine-4-phosphate dehydrogenase PdxA [Aquirufa sp.]